MALIPAKVIWVTDKTGVVLEEYQGKFALKAVQKYQSQGQEKVSYDWVYKQIWNPETRQRELPSKANATQSVYLGDQDQAIKALGSFLRELGGTPALTSEDVPF